jgi:phosphopantetheine--protein transferase-like protein
VQVLLLRQEESLWPEACLKFLRLQGHAQASFFREENGKPGLRQAGSWHCNASTIRGESLLAIAPFPVGVDWEHLDRRVSEERIARRYFSPEEADWMTARPGERRFRFFQLWTAKEAAVKLDGCGLYGGGLCECRIECGEEGPRSASLRGSHIHLRQQKTKDGFLLTVAAYHDFQLANTV